MRQIKFKAKPTYRSMNTTRMFVKSPNKRSVHKPNCNCKPCRKKRNK